MQVKTNAKQIKVPAMTTVPGVFIGMPLVDAQDILKICHNIGGYPLGPRGAVDRLAEALEEAGVTPSDNIIIFGEMYCSRNHEPI